MRRFTPLGFAITAALPLLASCGDSTGEDDSSQAASGTTMNASSGADTQAPTTGNPTTSDPATTDTPTTGAPPPGDTTSDDSADSSGDGGGPTPSAGCGNATPPSGSLTTQVEGQTGEYIVSLPPGYDPDTPYPLGFAFHGRNRTGPNCMGGDCAGFQATMENDAILIYMTSMGGTGWEGPGERELNVSFFDQVLTQLTEEACVDETMIFAAGTSSGAHFTNLLGCRYGDRLAAIVPVAGNLPEAENCVGRSAALVIHGWADPHVPIVNGENAREFWRMRNGCSETTDVPIPDVHQQVQDTPESNACAAFQGCDPGLPVVWCEHSEGGYDGSTHGWPLFGGQAVWDFVQSL